MTYNKWRKWNIGATALNFFSGVPPPPSGLPIVKKVIFNFNCFPKFLYTAHYRLFRG